MIGYRRYGHNETDDPETTQPIVYDKVKNHPTVSHLYQDQLKEESIIDDASITSIRDGVTNKLKEAYDQMKKNEVHEYYQRKISEPEAVTITPTAVPLENLRSINADLLKWPENFNVYPKLQRILQRRSTSLNEGEKVDWSLAETLAFATILADGKPIRISGQDAERATFAHRNLVLHDSENGAKFCPLHHLPQARASLQSITVRCLKNPLLDSNMAITYIHQIHWSFGKLNSETLPTVHRLYLTSLYQRAAPNGLRSPVW